MYKALQTENKMGGKGLLFGDSGQNKRHGEEKETIWDVTS